MRLGRDQHVGEFSEHVRADGLALVSTAQRPGRAFVGGNAEMVRPEPHQSLDQPNIGIDRNVVASLGLGEIDLLRDWNHFAFGTLPRARRRSGIWRHRLRAVLHLLRFLFCARGLALLPELEGGSRRRAAAEKIATTNFTGTGL